MPTISYVRPDERLLAALTAFGILLGFALQRLVEWTAARGELPLSAPAARAFASGASERADASRLRGPQGTRLREDLFPPTKDERP
jgi:hypothetical protein